MRDPLQQVSWENGVGRNALFFANRFAPVGKLVAQLQLPVAQASDLSRLDRHGGVPTPSFNRLHDLTAVAPHHCW